MLAGAAVRISCKAKWSIQPCAALLQNSRDAFLHQLDGVCGGGRAAYADSSQAVPGQHSHRQCHTGHQLANICVSCAPEQREVRLTAGNSPPPPSTMCSINQSFWPSKLCRLVMLVRSMHNAVHMCVVIDIILTCRLVVVLERRTLVHDLKTLELLRTLETPSNPKVT